MLSEDKKTIKKTYLCLKTLLVENIGSYVDLFFYEKPVDLPRDLSAILNEAGLIHPEKELWQANVMAFPFRGKFIITDFLLSYQRMKNGKYLRGIDDVWVMFPHETLLFIEELGKVSGDTVLDLASGSGAISLFLADQFKKVYSLDISPKAVKYARFNAILNNLEDKIVNLQSDLFQKLGGFKFSHIYWNGPTVALPELKEAKQPYPLYAYGGYDGAAFTKKFLNEVFSHVSSNYVIKWWDGSLGTKKRSVVDEYIRNNFSGTKISVTIEYLNKRGGVPLKEYEDLYIKYCLDKFDLNQDPETRQRAVEEWYKRLNKEGLRYVYISLITIKPADRFEIIYKYPEKTRVSAKNVYGFEWHFASSNYIKNYLMQNNLQLFQ